MLSADEMVTAMASIRDQFLAVITSHETRAHGGKPCWANRASACAYFAHTVAVRGSLWDEAKKYLAWYDANCQDAKCPHLIVRDHLLPPTLTPSVAVVREVSLQELSDCGINPFAAELLQESYSSHPKPVPVTFLLRGVRFSLRMETPS